MPDLKSHYKPPHSPSPVKAGHFVLTLLLLFSMAAGGIYAGSAFKQHANTLSDIPLSVTSALAVTSSLRSLDGAHAGGPEWKSLNKAQQTALAPLIQHWAVLSESRKREWLALVHNFDVLSPAGKQRLQARMSAWASLTSQQRSQARLNFAGAKNLPPNERRAQWEAYQALSPEDKARLAAQAKPRPKGAATAPRPVASDKLVRIPAARQPQNKVPNAPKLLPKESVKPELFAPVIPAPQDLVMPVHPEVLSQPIQAPTASASELPVLTDSAAQEGEFAGPPPQHLHDIYVH